MNSRRKRRQARPQSAAVVAMVVGSVALVLLAVPGASRAERRVEVYAPKHRLAAELEPVAQVVLDGRGSVAVDRGTNSLVLIGERDAIRKALTLLAEQDRALRQVVLRYDTRSRSALASQGFDVAWSATAGAFRVGRLRTRAGSGGANRVRGSATEDRLVATLRGVMRVVEGATTRIETGNTVPYAAAGSFGTNTQIVDATTGFEARPQILRDGRVRVDLAGFADRFAGEGAIASMRISTLVDLEPGKAVVVGAIDRRDAQSRSAVAAGAETERAKDATLLLLRADVEG